MPLSFAIDEQHVKQLANEIDNNGFATLNGVVGEAELAQLRAYTELHASQHPGEYFAYHGEQALADSLLVNIWADPGFKALLARLYRQAAGKQAPSDQIFPVLRCVQGNQGRRESNSFHFDASLVTALVPIFIPEHGEERGDLIVFPNVRRVRSLVLFNVIEKALLQNRFSRKLICMALDRGWFKAETLQLEPGNIYFFWGYRSLHANRPVSPNLKRATAIFHFGDPHTGSLATRLILKFNQRRARLVSEKTGSPPTQSTPS
ncbi:MULTISPECIES: hypothetical protein [unclassified Pseudomonas]|uniref:hypothetical protein n=1 Tax=unclassified Pseudomonas TaxID=196821 RepID=UPI002AC8B954|nr:MULTISPECIES: hypothetical protein [unclassified Pseudomonas]MEB0042399.1 hypothetical protein [Pseudomonas sp. MH10]MEB0079180.1 hypothetical protein [Pseudomonas sp. MH10out]MEB0092376.1 hypothetical protein [Pseudomonas sp. CCI4.2]MEB0102125.1 hypothetical protein [Pseudomonas sp. CCI3.2]MEB0122110.1 hypothetical protein [Pseudomonas sp. CCI1.2]